MRSFMVSMAIALATMIAGSMPASANWSCNGPEFVCGGGSASVASGQVTYSKSKKSKSYETASYSDEAPVKHKRSKGSYNSGSDEGGSSYQAGMASYYWEPQALASGGRFNPNALTAAHKTLPFGTRVRVTNQHNGSSVVVTINDRGPYVGGRIIDLSKAAAQEIGMTGAGVAPVRIAVLGRG